MKMGDEVKMKKGLVRCSERGEKEEEEEEVVAKFVARTLKATPRARAGESMSKYGWGPLEFEFHLIDLKRKEINIGYLPPVANPAGPSGVGSLLKLDSTVYILGGVSEKLADVPQEFEHHHVHTGCSKLDLTSLTTKSWEPFVLPYSSTRPANPATMFGSMYCFGAPLLTPKVWVVDSWRDLPLPSESSDLHQPLSTTPPVLPDPDNARFLVRLVDGRLFAFYPATATWDCLVSRLYFWHTAVALSNNILFFFEWGLPTIVIAFDIPNKKWLRVVEDFTKVGGFVRVYHAIYTFPSKDVICLVSGIPIGPDNPASVHFLTLRVQRSDDELKLTALDYQSYSIPHTHGIRDFLML